jgi:tyrosyl-tRNA synthetase
VPYKGGGLTINKIKVSDSHQTLDFKRLQEKYLLIQQGKKKHYLVAIQD